MSGAQKRLFPVGLLLLVILLLLSKPSLFAQSAKQVNSVTLITTVVDVGEVVAALAVEYPLVINNSCLTASSFNVEAKLGSNTAQRRITKVYTNNVPDTSVKSRKGKYVIIEMDPGDSNASATYWDEAAETTVRYDLDYAVSQTLDVTALNGFKFVTSEFKMKKTAEVTPCIAGFKKKLIKDTDGNFLNYRLFSPVFSPGIRSRKYPLVVFLHGAGERGLDNTIQIVMSKGALVWTTINNQKKNPSFVAAPQCPPKTYWNEEPNCILVRKMIDELKKQYPIDPNRIYITGLSMGGWGTWILSQNNPDLFAAAIPICGGGLPDKADAIKDMPIWAFHAADDPNVPVTASRDMVAALKAAGSTVIKYTEYEAGYIAPPLAPSAHFSWIPTYNNQEVIDWMFAQKAN